jgi:hypothetical protein
VVRRSEEVGKESLSEDGKVRYENADIVAKYRMYFRCYDHIIIKDGKAYLLLDAPDGVEMDLIREDELAYHSRLMEQILGPRSVQAVFTDLFPAIKSIYEDESEGHVVFLEFLSNHKAQVRGVCARSSKTDWRKHPYHAAGKLHAEMNAYKLGVKFVNHTASPVVLLPGQATMIYQPNEAKRPPLNYMFLEEFTTWDGFAHAVDRILKHVNPTKEAVTETHAIS